MAFSPTQIVLSEEMRQALDGVSKSSGVPRKVAQRAHIVLLAAQGLSNSQIADRVKLCQDTCSSWRVRFASEVDSLRETEAQGPEALRQRIVSLLEDDPRPGRPARFTADQIEQIRILSTRDPREVGVTSPTWTCSSLAKAVVQQGIVSTISAKTIWRFAHSGVLSIGDKA